ncbi:hypothetical protein MNBD_UNCLBAC01-276 [hydrothermal vent metagenome]|uniref:Glycoside hydrolase family 2 catalytic domain-containing protein n=1 Tax=hydrothermal vent metagenome TaxID=652676 RepID=A0A3B1DHT6_9ZZZZ
MKKFLFSTFLVMLILAYNNPAVLANSSNNTLLVDDFSFINPYVNVSLNPYWQNATPPLWGSSDDPYSDAYHTNNLGFYVGSGPYEGRAKVEWGGFRSFSWDASQSAWWWYTHLTNNNSGTDTTAYHFLTMRVKGEIGKIGNDKGERFKVKIEDVSGNFHIRYIDQYISEAITAEWQTLKIPLSDYAGDVDLKNIKAIVLVFSSIDVRNSTEKIYFDDIAFMPEFDLVPASDNVTKISVNAPVKVENKQLFVNNQPFFIKGVGYEPVPLGQTALWEPTEPFTQSNAERDFPLLAQMGINTIRTWGKINNALINDGTDPYSIKLCASFWVPHEISFLNEFAKQHIKQDFINYVTQYKDEPSLLMWVVGNENNLLNGYDWRWYAFANDLAKSAYGIEGEGYHPVAIIEGDKDTIGNVQMGSDDGHLNYIDIVGYNLYRGKTFTDFFDVYSTKTNKPLWVSEYGTDAWYSYSKESPWDGVENEIKQKNYNVSAWVDIVRHKDKNIGATVMSYADGWWKDSYYFSNDDWEQPNDRRHLSIHDFGGAQIEGLADGFSNEEWWGIVKYDETNVTKVIPRQVFYHLYSTTIGGRVLDSANNPIVSAKIVLTGPQHYKTKTDELGLYHFTKILPGSYTVSVPSEGMAPINVTVNNQETKVVDFQK